MGSTLDNFDTLCQQVFLPSKTADDNNADSAMTTPAQEIALSLLSRAQIYELPTPLPSASAEGTQNDKQYYRIHLEELEDRQQQQKVSNILIQAIDPSLLVTLPYDRNLSGYSSKTRTEATAAPLESTMVLDMGGLSSPEPSNESTLASSSSTTDSKSDIDDDTTSKTMLLVSVKEWLRLTGRIRFWRAESHRVKAAQREIVLNGLLEERWRTVTSSASPSTSVPSPPQSSGSPTAAVQTPKSLPSSAVSSPSTLSPSLTSSVPASPPASVVPSALTKLSTYKQPFQEHQLEFLVQFMATYGDEPSATSILRGLLDLTRRQLTDATVLSWTFDRANLTEQKPEVTLAFLDLIARLGLELVNSSVLETAEQQQKDATKRPVSAPTTSYSSTASDATVVATFKSATLVQSTGLTWTFGTRIDDHRLEYWIHHLQQNTLPVAKVDHQSLLPSTASFASVNNHNAVTTGSTSLSSGSEQKPNPIPLAIRKRFLQDRQTIPAGTIQPLINPHTYIDTNATTKGTNTILRDSNFVLATSKYTLSSPSSSSSQGLFMNVKKDVKDLARWASTCGGRLDWIWAWLFSSFQKSRREARSAHQKPRSNDENV